ncbi:hypothetical protein BOX15_Mlig029945g1 [Macrostomum lignano]|uniref:Uncharacterized protein n=1 Tax=Macrostomum lignano TaxID=282301 RepID=A0A267H8C5_9PLAT|nr:hypothetical protein BOX15_Mlig029945g1 [Macrostomum lignano]
MMMKPKQIFKVGSASDTSISIQSLNVIPIHFDALPDALHTAFEAPDKLAFLEQIQLLINLFC